MEKQARTVLVSTAVILAALLLWSWQNRPPEAEQVQVGTASVQDIYNSVTITGTVEAADSTALCPAENAVVAAVYASVGDTVEQGEVLCTLADVPQEAGSETVQAVWESLSGQSAHTVTAGQANILCAPVSGTVLTIPSVGEAVIAGLPCIRVADLSSLRVRAQSPELYAGELAAGQRANVTASAAGDTVYGAQVDSVSPVAVRAMSLTGQSGEATVETILSLCGDTEGLRPGYSASVKIFTEYHPDAVVVPHEAVCQRGEQEYVFCVENGHAVQCPVTTGYMLETVTEIVEGLAPDAAVVLSPSDTLTDGAPVEVAA